MADPIVVAEGLHKSFGDTHALRGLDLSVREARSAACSGPNGAGKTTAVRILATLSDPDAGHAAHRRIRRRPRGRRGARQIGLAGQYAAVDEKLTGRREPAHVRAALPPVPARGAPAGRRAARPLRPDGRRRPPGRRLLRRHAPPTRPDRQPDRCAPTVLFLDEPTTGLDPRSRGEIWDVIRELVADGTTVLLTTQYLDEADQLADDIAVIDHGQVIATGTPDELKATIGRPPRRRRSKTPPRCRRGGDRAVALAGDRPDADRTPTGSASPCRGGGLRLADIVRELDRAGVAAADVRPAPPHPRRGVPAPHRPTKETRSDDRRPPPRRWAAACAGRSPTG